MHKWLLNGCLFMVCMDKAGGDGGGAGGGSGDGKGDGKGSGDGAPDLKAINERLEKLEKENADLKKAAGGKGKDDKVDDPDLEAKAKAAREAKEKASGDTKKIEAALKFSLGAKDFLKQNASLLPKDIEGIFEAADKEKYDNAIEKDSAIKASMVQSFFNVQSNLDLLTLSQKSVLEDFLKLTKNGKQEKAQSIYETIFEPTFEMFKRIKKAEQLGKDGQVTASDTIQAYSDRMQKMSKKHYMGEKADA